MNASRSMESSRYFDCPIFGSLPCPIANAADRRSEPGKRRAESTPAELNRVLCGDCIELLPQLPKGIVDLVVTDPPYLCNYKDRTNRTVINDDQADWLRPSFQQVYRMLKPNSLCVSFYGWHRVDDFMAAWRSAGFRPVGHIVWAKSYASNSRYLSYTHEQAYLLAKGRPALPADPMTDTQPWTYSRNRLHPTEKHPSIFEEIVKSFTEPGEIVLDPFAGSGSALVAAKRLGRNFIGCDIDPDHVRRANKRLAVL